MKSKSLKKMNKSANITIFLDIDGVLNTRDSWKTPFQLNDKCIQAFCTFLLEKCDNPNIVLTSSWKNGYSSLPENETEQLGELRSKLARFGIKINGRTRTLQNRMQEINDYIAKHEMEYYAIIDDDSAEYSADDLKKVLLIDSRTGFTEAQGKKIKWNKVKK